MESRPARCLLGGCERVSHQWKLKGKTRAQIFGGIRRDLLPHPQGRGGKAPAALGYADNSIPRRNVRSPGSGKFVPAMHCPTFSGNLPVRELPDEIQG